MSPLIFNVLVEDFIESSTIIKQFVEEGRCLYYADDAIIFHKDKQRLADCLKEYVSHGSDYGMSVNMKKTVWSNGIRGDTGNKDGDHLHPEFPIEYHSTIKYLGLKIDLADRKRWIGMVKEQCKRNLCSVMTTIGKMSKYLPQQTLLQL